MNWIIPPVAVLALLGEAHARPVPVGDPAPLASAPDQHGEIVSLEDLYANSEYVLVYFYPRAGTPGCTAQACSLRDAYELLQERGVEVVGVSTDSVEAQADFTAAETLPFILLADEDQEVVEAFGVPTTGGIASRQAFLIHDGLVVWRDLSASTSEQAEDVLSQLDGLDEVAAHSESDEDADAESSEATK